MPNYEKVLLKIMQRKDSNKWEQLYSTLAALSTNEVRLPAEIAEYGIDDDDPKVSSHDVTLNNFTNNFYEILRKGEQNPGFITRKFYSSSKFKKNPIADEFIREYSKVLKSHGYPNDSDANKFNEKVLAKIISKCLEMRKLDLVKKMLEAFSTPILLNSITPVDDIIYSSYFLDFVNIYSEFGDASLLDVANTYELHTYKEHLPDLSKDPVSQRLANKFLHKIQVLQTQMELAQSWAIKAYPVGAKRELLNELGKSTRIMQTGALRKIAFFIEKEKKEDLIAKVREELLSRNNEVISENIMGQIVTNTLHELEGVDIEETLEEIDDLSKKFLRNPSKPRYLLISFSQGLTSHAIATAFWQDKFCIVNRGGYAKNPRFDGMHLFTLKPNVRNELLKMAGRTANIKSSLTEQDFTNYIFKNAQPFGEVMHMTRQVVGNCPWVASKSIAWMSAYFNTLKLIKEQKLSVDDATARAIATVFYKYLVKQRKICTLKEYLKLPEAERGSPELLATVYNKMHHEKWQDVLPEFLSDFPDATKQFADEMLTEKFKTAISEGDDKVIKKLLPIIKASNIKKAPFVVEALSFTLEALAEPKSQQESSVGFDVCFRDLQTLLSAGMVKANLPDIEKMIEDHITSLIDSGRTINLENKEKLLELVKTTAELHDATGTSSINDQSIDSSDTSSRRESVLAHKKMS